MGYSLGFVDFFLFQAKKYFPRDAHGRVCIYDRSGIRLGYLRPKQEYKLFAMADGLLVSKLASEGDEVRPDQVLFVINNAQQSIRLRNAQEVYELAQQNYSRHSPVLRELALGIATAASQLQNDSLNYERFRSLWAQNACSKVDYDRAKLSYETAQNNYQLQKTRYDKAKDDLWMNLQNAQSQVRINAEQNGDYLLKSLIEGQVFEIYKEQGEAVKARRGDCPARLE
ncbi:MAG: hypothetical protein HC912_12680 [Saprospiraceae bacterium]|nr:hypothetical protein [Saprospiraceae bacterium]